MTTDIAVQKLDDLLNEVFQETISVAKRLAETTANILHTQQDIDLQQLKLGAAQRTALQAELKQALSQCQFSYGMGFASYCGSSAAAQEYWTLEWWFKKDHHPQQAKLENYQNAQRFLDFRGFDWFRMPEKNQQLYIQGPYVDYICNAAYTITTAYPVMVQGQFVGVIAIDLLVSTLERLFLPCLTAIKQCAVIINAQHRVLTSNSVNFRTGSLLQPSSLGRQVQSKQPFQVLVL